MAFRAPWQIGTNYLSAVGSALAQLAIAADERVGRAVVRECWVRGALQLGNDPLRQDLAKLHAPLIERIDLPNGALSEHAVLVQRHQLAQHVGREALGHDDVGWPVPLE